MALDQPPWADKAINKIRQSYMWRGQKEASGGHCLIAWPKVTHPKEMAGLGISDLKILNWALRLKWLWLRKTELSKPWASFRMQVNAGLQAFFSMVVVSEVGDGTNTLFWKARWLSRQEISDLASLIAIMIPKRISNKSAREL
jgi:hypothetical protein